MSFHAAVDRHGWPFLRDARTNLAVIAAIDGRNDGATPGSAYGSA